MSSAGVEPAASPFGGVRGIQFHYEDAERAARVELASSGLEGRRRVQTGRARCSRGRIRTCDALSGGWLTATWSAAGLPWRARPPNRTECLPITDRPHRQQCLSGENYVGCGSRICPGLSGLWAQRSTTDPSRVADTSRARRPTRTVLSRVRAGYVAIYACRARSRSPIRAFRDITPADVGDLPC